MKIEASSPALLACLVLAVGVSGAAGRSVALPGSAGPVAGSAPHEVVHMPVYASDTFRQRVLWGKSLDRGDRQRFQIEETVKDEADGVWTKHLFDYRAEFEIVDVATRGRGEFYLLGSGEQEGRPFEVIEHWQARHAGVPQDPKLPHDIERTELYRGDALGPIHALDVDPEGRFVVVISTEADAASRLTQVELPSLVTTTLARDLEDATSIWRCQHATRGRVWIVTGRGMSWVLLLEDAANDGTFERQTRLDYDAWDALDLYLGVVDDFLSM